MRTVPWTCCVAAGAALLSSLDIVSAAAQGTPPSAYAGFGGGFVFKNDQDFTSARATSDTGWGVLGSVGYRWGNGLRTEFETAYRRNDGTFKDLLSATNTGGDVQSLDLMFNGLYDFHISSMPFIEPYVGVGIGAALNKYSFGDSPKGTDFAYQGIVGLTWKITEIIEAFVDYRYLATAGQGITLQGRAGDDQYKTQNVFLGIRWTFWTQAPPPAPPAPPPTPKPVNWTVYFEYNKSNLTEAAGSVLDEIKTETPAAQRVSVVGHTDSSGSDAYNEMLSERRAKSTADGLTGRGVTVGNESGVGESDPAVPTADGVKEPLNRRAVVKLEGQ